MDCGLIFKEQMNMKASVTKENEYVTEIKIVNIDAASEEEAQISSSGLSRICPQSLVSKGPYNGFFVVAVMTFSGPDLPVGTEISFVDNSQHWMIIEKNKATRHIRFNPDEYEEDKEKLRNKLRDWAERNGFVFG